MVGGNGSGKSTLTRVLTQLYRAEAGAILWDGALVDANNAPRYRNLFSAVYADFHLFDRLYGMEGVDPEHVRRLLADVGLADKTAYVDGRFTNVELSTGQRKRLALVVALIEDRPIYVLDELSADQDPVFRQRYYKEFLPALKARGKTLIVVSHDERYFDIGRPGDRHAGRSFRTRGHQAVSINTSDLRRAAQGNRALSIVIGVLLAVGLALLLLWNAILVRIPPGHVGVLYSLFFGTVTDDVHPEGLALKLPWNRMYIFDARWQALPFHVDAFSQEGMPIKVEATIIFKLRRPQVGHILVELGPDYAEQFVKPIATGAVRLLISRYNSHELYTVDYKDLYDRLMELLQNSAEARFFDYHDVIVRRIELPVGHRRRHPAQAERRADRGVLPVPPVRATRRSRTPAHPGDRAAQLLLDPAGFAHRQAADVARHRSDRGDRQVAQQQDRHRRRAEGPDAADPGLRVRPPAGVARAGAASAREPPRRCPTSTPCRRSFPTPAERPNRATAPPPTLLNIRPNRRTP